MNVDLFVTQQTKRCLVGRSPRGRFPRFFAFPISSIREELEPGFISEGNFYLMHG